IASRRHLANDQVQSALLHLIRHLHADQPAVLGEQDPEVPFEPGREVEFLVWNIRRRWGLLFREAPPAATQDLIGILRTLLHSIQAHAWNTGSQRGYVEFLDGFMAR